MTLLLRQEKIYCQHFYRDERQFSAVVKTELSRVFPEFSVVDFAPFILGDEGIRRRPDLALVDRNYTMWVVVEVELDSHSLAHHVEPQIRAFVTGRYDDSHAQLICERDNALDFESLSNLIFYSPPFVTVVVNSRSVLESGWTSLESDYGAHLVFLETYRAENGDVIFSLSGLLPTPRPTKVIRLKKHKMLNALVCAHPSDMPASVVEVMEVYFLERLYRWSILRTRDTIVMLAPAGLTVRADRNYEIRLSGEDRFFLHQL